MLQTKFLSAGSSKKEALKYTCELVSNIFLEDSNYPRVKKIDIRCESAKEAEELDKLLWDYPEDIILPHSLTHKTQEDVFIEIGYPGSTFLKEDKKMLLNLNPDLPNQIAEYLYYYQLVISDNSKMRERAASTWQECKSMGLNPSFLEN